MQPVVDLIERCPEDWEPDSDPAQPDVEYRCGVCGKSAADCTCFDEDRMDLYLLDAKRDRGGK
jgi:hypothetical protein